MVLPLPVSKFEQRVWAALAFKTYGGGVSEDCLPERQARILYTNYMHCPNCRHILTVVDLDNTQVEHCNSCGGTLFEENEINRITLKDAERLALMKQTDVISAGDKISPRDGSAMTRINRPSIPNHITLLGSESTGEVFAYPDDLVEFKQAQDAKVNYYKTWRIPMPALQQVLVFGIIVMAAASLAYVSRTLQGPGQKTSIQAQTLCENGVGIIDLENSYLVSCTTAADLSCTAAAECDGQTIAVELSEAQNTHFGNIPKECSTITFTCLNGDEEIVVEEPLR